MADLIMKGMHGCSREDEYVRPENPLIQERLEWFQDQKLALMMHFGIYSQMGICESWPLSNEDADWSRKGVTWEDDEPTFRKQYVDMFKSFNPVCIRPDQWAEFAKENGFKYLIFTTKHHDGFCMFDTKYTDYKLPRPTALSIRTNTPTSQSMFWTHSAKKTSPLPRIFPSPTGIARGTGPKIWICPWATGEIPHTTPKSIPKSGTNMSNSHTTRSWSLWKTTAESIFCGWTAARSTRKTIRMCACRKSSPAQEKSSPG